VEEGGAFILGVGASKEEGGRGFVLGLGRGKAVTNEGEEDIPYAVVTPDGVVFAAVAAADMVAEVVKEDVLVTEHAFGERGTSVRADGVGSGRAAVELGEHGDESQVSNEGLGGED
jgi:hypothetical protein